MCSAIGTTDGTLTLRFENGGTIACLDDSRGRGLHNPGPREDGYRVTIAPKNNPARVARYHRVFGEIWVQILLCSGIIEILIRFQGQSRGLLEIGLGIVSAGWDRLRAQDDALFRGKVLGEVVPLSVDQNATQAHNGLHTVAAPPHTRTVEANPNEVANRTFDHAAADVQPESRNQSAVDNAEPRAAIRLTPLPRPQVDARGAPLRGTRAPRTHVRPAAPLREPPQPLAMCA